VEQTLQQLVQLIMNTAPEMWRMARGQVNVQIVMALIWIVVATVALVCSIVIAKYVIKPNDNYWPTEDNKEEMRIEKAKEDLVVTCASFVLVYIVVVIVAIYIVVPKILNPDWYAVEVLRSLVR
jgi:hypothetical protein